MFWAPLEVWLGEHPLIHWFLVHPFILLGLGLIALLLLAGLMSAIAYLTQSLWLRLLQLPVQLIQVLGNAIAIGLKRVFQMLFSPSSSGISDEWGTRDNGARSDIKSTYSANADAAIVLSNTTNSEGPTSHATDLPTLLKRLEQVRQEEAELIEQIKALVEERSP